MVTPTSPTPQIPLPKADAEYISLCEEGLYEDFWLSFSLAPYFKFLSAAPSEASMDGLPHLHFRWSGEDPDTVCNLLTRVPPDLLLKFVNKDIVLYVRPGGRGDIARDLFMAWYPHRPPVPTQIAAVANLSNNLFSTSGQQPSQHENLPTDADIYGTLRQAFCVAMEIGPDDGTEGFSLSELIRYHYALVHLIKAEIDETAISERALIWSRGLIGLGGGFEDGFCIHEGPGVIGTYRYPHEKRDTRAGRELKVVGRESWIQRGWGIDGVFDTQSWDEVDGICEEVVNRKWWSCTMPLQDAVDGVIRASGEEGRFDEKHVSEFFRSEFLEPEQLSEKEIQDLLKLNEDLLKRLRGERGRAAESRVEV